MKVQSPRAIQLGDLEGAPEWVGRLLAPLNAAVEQLNSPMQGRLSHKDNLHSEIRRLTVEHETDFSFTLQKIAGKAARVTVSQVHTLTPCFPRLWWAMSPSDQRRIDAQVSLQPDPGEPVDVTLLVEGD